MGWALGVVLMAGLAIAAPPGRPRTRATETTSAAGATKPSTSGAEVSRAETSTTAEPLELMRGEITHAGSVRRVPKVSFVGARLGAWVQETTVFLRVAPKVDLILLERRLKIGVEVPLNLEIYSGARAAEAGRGGGGFSGLGTPRPEDYDEARDFAKILRYLSYGRPEDPYYFGLGQLFATTLGHGLAMRRYAANVDLDSTKVGAKLEADLGHGGLELALADITRANLFAGLVFVRPLAAWVDAPFPRSLSLGLSWASDQRAPWALRRDAPVGAAPLGPVRVDAVGSPLADTRAVNIYGVNADVKLAATAASELWSYLEVSHLGSGGTGTALGALWSFSARGATLLHLLKTRLELRTYAANYQPSYFDVLYEFQKFESVEDPSAPASPTKFAAIAGREGAQRVGVYVEVSYALVNHLVVAFAFETSSSGQDRNLMLHAEVPLRYLDLFATYQQRSFDRVFSFDLNDVFFAGARLQIFPFLFLDGRVQKNFVWDRSLHAGLGGYAEQLNVQGDLEFGLQF